MELLTVTVSGVAVDVCPLTGVWVLVTVRVGVALPVGDVVTVFDAVRVTVGDGVRVDVAVRVSVGVAVRVRDAVGVGVREDVTVGVRVDVRVTVGGGVFVGVPVIVRARMAAGVRVEVGAIDAALVRDAGETANASAITTKMGAIAIIRLVEMRLPIML
jgi:hypothetical protein